jgi:hypothetical protein
MMRRYALASLACALLLLSVAPGAASEELEYSMTYSVPSEGLEMIFDGEAWSVYSNPSSLDPRVYWYDNGESGMRNLRSFTEYDLSHLPVGADITGARLIIKPYLFRLDSRLGPFICLIEAVEYGPVLDQDPDLSDGDQSDFSVQGISVGEFTVSASVSSPFEYDVTSAVRTAAMRDAAIFQVRCSKAVPDQNVSIFQEVKFEMQLAVTYSVAPAEPYGLLRHVAQYCLRIAQDEWECVVPPTAESSPMAEWYWGLARFHLNNARNLITPEYTVGQVRGALQHMRLLENESGSACE